jgi:tryptophan-rich sensory protein
VHDASAHLLLLLQTWALLYGVMGTASYLVGKQAGWRSYPMGVYAAQLLLNLAWQPIFFLLKRPGVAQVENAGDDASGFVGSGC